jgi:hypothetical protein
MPPVVLFIPLIRLSAKAPVGFFVMFGLLLTVVEDRPQLIFPPRMASCDVEELLHSVWALSPQLVQQSLACGP